MAASALWEMKCYLISQAPGRQPSPQSRQQFFSLVCHRCPLIGDWHITTYNGSLFSVLTFFEPYLHLCGVGRLPLSKTAAWFISAVRLTRICICAPGSDCGAFPGRWRVLTGLDMVTCWMGTPLFCCRRNSTKARQHPLQVDGRTIHHRSRHVISASSTCRGQPGRYRCGFSDHASPCKVVTSDKAQLSASMPLYRRCAGLGGTRMEAWDGCEVAATAPACMILVSLTKCTGTGRVLWPGASGRRLTV
jgi:hypothetical protein